jgi:hypothetical protein
MKRSLLFLLASWVVVGCSSAVEANDPSGVVFPEQALSLVQSTSQKLAIEVRTAPDQPPTRGDASVLLTVREASGASRDGLEISVLPWMPEMGHGASIVPTVTAEGGGKYLLTNVDLFMPGRWELRATVAGALSDSAVVSLQIP